MVNSTRTANTHITLFLVAVITALITIGLIVPARAQAKVYTTESGKTCTERLFSTGSQSVCVSYIISLMNASGKVSKANRLIPGVNFGARTKAAVQEFQSNTNTKGGADGIVGPNTWAKLCSLGSSSQTAWTKAGCGGQATNTYRTKPAATANSADYRWGYFNCYPTSKRYPTKPVWACERMWVKKTATIKDGSGVWVIASKHANVQKRYNQFQRDIAAYDYSKALQTQSLSGWASSKCSAIGSIKVKTIAGKATSYCKASTL